MNFEIFCLKPSSLFQNNQLDLAVIPVFKGKFKLPISASPLTEELKYVLEKKDLSKNLGATIFHYTSKHAHEEMKSKGRFCPSRILLWELFGEKTNNINIKDACKKLGGIVSAYEKVGIILPEENKNVITESLIVSLSNILSDPSVKKHGSEKKIATLDFYCSGNIEKSVHKALVLAEGFALNKRLALLPANKLTPQTLAEEAQKLSEEKKLKIKIFDEQELLKMEMGGITGVSQGSTEDAKLIVLEYNPGAKKAVALVGKGITFDSGGISLKPSKDMHEMKYDMIGGATVMAILSIASGLKLPIHLIGVIAASENLPGNNSLKPGDVIRTYSGKTVEVLNTDAEGRLVLCDGLSFAQKHYKLNAVIDIATLTGAISVSLGNKISGVFGNNPNLNKQLENAAKTANEDIFFLPLFQKYLDELKSHVADFTNIGKQRCDALIAALFLEQFIENNTPWIHLDIGGTAWNNEGPTGAMIQSLVGFLSSAKL